MVENPKMKLEGKMEEEILSEEETMHEIKEWEEDYAEMQAEFYEENI